MQQQIIHLHKGQIFYKNISNRNFDISAIGQVFLLCSGLLLNESGNREIVYLQFPIYRGVSTKEKKKLNESSHFVSRLLYNSMLLFLQQA